MDELTADDECPGETFCKTQGRCVSRDFDDHCQPGVCSLYYTKPGVEPSQYKALLEAAIRLRERQLNDLYLDETEYVEFEMLAFMFYCRAERIVEKQRADKQNAENANNANGGQPGRGWQGGDSTAFQWTKEQLDEMYKNRQAALEKQRLRKKQNKLKEQQ